MSKSRPHPPSRWYIFFRAGLAFLSARYVELLRFTLCLPSYMLLPFIRKAEMLDELSALRVLHKQDTAARLHNISLVAEMLSTGAQTRMTRPASLTRAQLGIMVGEGGLRGYCSAFFSSSILSSAPLAWFCSMMRLRKLFFCFPRRTHTRGVRMARSDLGDPRRRSRQGVISLFTRPSRRPRSTFLPLCMTVSLLDRSHRQPCQNEAPCSARTRGVFIVFRLANLATSFFFFFPFPF